jgi:hypothetical protein
MRSFQSAPQPAAARAGAARMQPPAWGAAGCTGSRVLACRACAQTCVRPMVAWLALARTAMRHTRCLPMRRDCLAGLSGPRAPGVTRGEAPPSEAPPSEVPTSEEPTSEVPASERGADERGADERGADERGADKLDAGDHGRR